LYIVSSDSNYVNAGKHKEKLEQRNKNRASVLQGDKTSMNLIQTQITHFLR